MKKIGIIIFVDIFFILTAIANYQNNHIKSMFINLGIAVIITIIYAIRQHLDKKSNKQSDIIDIKDTDIVEIDNDIDNE